MSKLKNVRRRQARRYMMREWAREVSTPTFPPSFPNACWFRFPPALVPRLMIDPTSGRRWKKLTESYRLSPKPVDHQFEALIARLPDLEVCRYCGDLIADDDDGWFSTGDFGGTGTGAWHEREYCVESPDHEHSPAE